MAGTAGVRWIASLFLSLRAASSESVGWVERSEPHRLRQENGGARCTRGTLQLAKTAQVTLTRSKWDAILCLLSGEGGVASGENPVSPHSAFPTRHSHLASHHGPRTTEGATLAAQQSVLIVDRSEETREVLRTALERRGMQISPPVASAGARNWPNSTGPT